MKMESVCKDFSSDSVSFACHFTFTGTAFTGTASSFSVDCYVGRHGE